MNDILKEKISNVEDRSGCYIYKDIDGNVLYVGKAKRLKTRVNQYFDRVYFNKTANLVKQIYDVDFIITFTEKEALVLEINLIKQYMPPFNIIFMDDKHYPYIAISKEEFPRLLITRNAKNKKYIHYGPFPNSKDAYNVINLLNQIYPLRKCKNIPKTTCLYYSLHQCLGPCINKIDSEIEKEYVKQIDRFFKGDNKEIINDLTLKMYEASDNLNFERANEYKNLIIGIKNITNKQIIEFNDKVSRDIVGFYVKEGYLSISVLMYRNGYLNAKINEVSSFFEEIEEAIITYLMQFYQTHDLPKEIYISDNINLSIIKETLNINIVYPKIAQGQQLITMAIENAKQSLENKFIELSSKDEDIFIELGNYLNKSRISTIEMCDMSHISGDSAVGVVVVFQNGYPMKNKYRKFNILQENKQDDLASTYEVIYRRFYNLLKENQPYSDLLIVDGGINQMNVAKKALNELNIDSVLVCGLAKDDHHKTRAFITNDEREIPLKNDSKLFLFLMRMQEEVHRFAITTFRNKKSKGMIVSLLDSIDGLGKTRVNRLLSIYHSLDEIKKAPLEQLKQILPEKVAINLLEKLNEK